MFSDVVLKVITNRNPDEVNEGGVKMLTRPIKDWLSEYKGLSNNEVLSFACGLSVNEELISDLFTLFETPPFYVQELDPVCHQLYEFYRSKEEKLKRFALQFVPTLIWLYLRCLSLGQKKVCGGVETLLLGVYNLEIVNPDGTPVVETFRIPTINKASLYHESKIPGVTEPLTEQSLRSLNKSHLVWKSGPYQQHERFLAQNRFNILTFVMHCYNNSIDRFHELSLKALCTALISLNESGFSQSNEFKQLPMISLFPSLIVEMLVAVYFAMFNGQKKAALAAIQVAHQRASFELYSDVLLITNAMSNSYHRGNFSFDNHEVNIEAQKTAQAVKHRITNASFKATKLPDDIEIVEEEESPRLSTVDEDQEHSLAKNIKAKLRNKLGVDKNKNRETSRRNSDTPSMKSGSGSELTDGLGVIVRSGGGNSGIVVDMLEMQPLKDGPDRDKNQLGDGKHSKSSPSPSVLSKKSGLKKTLSGSDTTGKSQSYTLTTSYSSSSSLSPNPVSANGRASSATLIGSSHSKNSSPLNKSNYLEPSYRAHSEGPVISSLSSSAANQKENELASCSNLSEPTLHTTLSPAHPPPSSLSTHSIPAEVLSGSGSEKPAKKQQLVNRNSCSTNL